MKKLKNKRGFSLVELMVVVAIMGTLAAIAIPAYNEYRKSAKKTSYRTDLLSLHKGWLAFGVELDSFCERETSPTNASINNVGMASLLSSKLYGNNPGKWNFIGFANQDAAANPCSTTPTLLSSIANPSSLSTAEKAIAGLGNNSSNTAVDDDDCTVGIVDYKMGVFGHLSGDSYIGLQTTHNGVVTERSETTGNQTGLDTTCA